MILNQLYLSETSQLGSCPGFNMYADPVGGKWFESFWGLINVHDLEVVEHNRHFRLRDNAFSMFPVEANIYFSPDRMSTTVNFDLPLQIQPFSAITMSWLVTAINLRYANVVKTWIDERGGSFESFW